VTPHASGGNDGWAIRSWRGLAVGAFFSFAVPIVFFIVGLLENLGLEVDWRMPAGLIVLTTGLLGLTGLVVVGRSVGAHGVTWLPLIILGVPLQAVILFVSLLYYGGATGSPF